MDVDKFASDCLMEENISKILQAPKVTSLVAKILNRAPTQVSFFEVDGDGALIFECDDDPRFDPAHIFVDIFKKRISSDGGTARPINVKGLRKRLGLTPSMVKYLKSCSGE